MIKIDIARQVTILFLLFRSGAGLIGCSPAGDVTISRERNDPAVCMVETNAVFVASNRYVFPVNVWQVSDDGFGYDIEVFQNGKWKSGTNRYRCATGRNIIEIPSGGSYTFAIPTPTNTVAWRVSIEYWEGEYGENPVKRISSDRKRLP